MHRGVGLRVVGPIQGVRTDAAAVGGADRCNSFVAQVRVRTWFDQPGKKKSRRLKRDAKVRVGPGTLVVVVVVVVLLLLLLLLRLGSGTLGVVGGES